MSSRRSLDNATVKEFTSGDAHPTVRAAFGATTRSMTWTAKLQVMLAFNDGECPKLRAEDDALMARLVVIQHRAKFCRTRQDFDDYRARGEEHVHMVDVGAEAAVTPQRALRWALEGLDRYRREGFSQLPEIFSQWRNELMMEHDDVAAWAAVHVTSQPEKHFLLAAAHESFLQLGVQLNKQRFSARLQRLFPGAYHAQKKVAGVKHCGVFTNLSIT